MAYIIWECVHNLCDIRVNFWFWKCVIRAIHTVPVKAIETVYCNLECFEFTSGITTWTCGITEFPPILPAFLRLKWFHKA